MPQDSATSVPWRIQGAVYLAGLFSNSSLHLYNIIVPLWVGLLTRDPLVVGIVLGARHVLPLLFSIHGGALMDRYGTRRVLLILAATSLAIPPLYPVMPWVVAVAVLQMLGGYTIMTSWVGVQTMIGSMMQAQPVYAGRLTFATRLGTVAGPPLVGWCWDAGGPWGAFGMMSLWAAATFVCAASLPLSGDATDRSDKATKSAAGLRNLLPSLSDYADAFRLLAIPAIATVITATMLRHAGVALQGTFYVYYLGEIGISGKWIGLLFSCTGICGIVGSMFVGRMARRFAARPLLLTVVAVSIASVAVTPLLRASGFVIAPDFLNAIRRSVSAAFDVTDIAPYLGFYLLLLLAQGVRGLTSAVSQSMEIAMTAQAAGNHAQGKGVALRLTAGRFSAVVLPVLMGAVARLVGLENSFYVVGGMIFAVLAWVGVRGQRAEPGGGEA